MEYKILGIPENATLEETKKALKKIKVDYHPDKYVNATEEQLKRNLHYIHLAEEAYRQIKEKMRVNNTFKELAKRNNIFSVFNDTEHNIVESMQKMQRNIQHPFNFMNMPENSSSSTSYTYKNINGNITESGKINGKNMNVDELRNERKKFPTFLREPTIDFLRQ